MKKVFLKITSVVLSVIIFAASFSGCAPGMIEADASQYLTKGEWFAYFASETDLQSTSITVDLPLDENSQYYYSVLAIVEREIIDAETACKDLDKIVNKDTVSYTCVNYLLKEFRKSSDLKFSDEKNITDPEAAAEAVDYGFVEPKSKKKFGPDEYMDIDSCEKAIESTIEYFTDYSFSEEERNFEIEYQDNVYETDAEVEVLSGRITDYTDNSDDSVEADALVNTNNLSVDFLGLRSSSQPKAIKLAQQSGDVLTFMLPRFYYIQNQKAYKKGNIVKVQEFNLVTELNRNVSCCFIKITEDPVLVQYKDGYMITGVLPTTEEAIKAVKENQKASDKAKDGKITENNKAAGVSGFQVTGNGVKFSYSTHADKTIDFNNGRSNKTDPTLSGDLSFSIEISDIELRTTGFDTIFTDTLFGKTNATVELKYKTTVNASASFPKTRLAPYNNGNGKFPSNLSRSRLTTGNGAKDIKIGKVKYVFGPLVAEFGLYLQVYIDGHIEVVLTKESKSAYTIKNNHIEKVQSSSKSKLEANFEVNLYAGVELRGNLHLMGFASIPICDMKAGAGFEMKASGSFFVLNKEGKYTDKMSTNLSGDELQATVSSQNDISWGYCLNVKLDFKIYGQIASGDCIIGKIIKLFNSDFNGLYGEQLFPIFEKHWEDGHEVNKCTREPADGTDDKDGKDIKCGDKLDISNYNLVLDEGTCGVFYVTQVPGKEKNKEKTEKRISVISTDENVCTATYYRSNHMVEVSAVGEGACEIWITTLKINDIGLNRIEHISCAIIVNANKQVSFVPQDFNYRIIHL